MLLSLSRSPPHPLRLRKWFALALIAASASKNPSLQSTPSPQSTSFYHHDLNSIEHAYRSPFRFYIPRSARVLSIAFVHHNKFSTESFEVVSHRFPKSFSPPSHPQFGCFPSHVFQVFICWFLRSYVLICDHFISSLSKVAVSATHPPSLSIISCIYTNPL